MKKAVEWVLNLVTTVIAQACSLDAKYVTIQGGGDWDKMTSIVKEIYNYLAIAGIAFTLVYFLMEMNEKLALEGRDLTMKSFFAPFLKLMVAIAVISQSGKIVSSIIMFNDTFITKISNLAKAGDTTQAPCRSYDEADGDVWQTWILYFACCADYPNAYSDYRIGIEIGMVVQGHDV